MAFATLDQSPSRSPARPAFVVMRRVLDAAYRWSAYLAAASMVTVLLLTMAQIVTRYAHITATGLSDYAGYFMAASAFLAFAHALNRGSHVRIELILGIAGRHRYVLELVSMGLGALIASWFAYYACKMVYWSYRFGDLSTGLDATPLWIPQLTMAFGAVLFAVAIADQWLRLLLTGAHTIPRSDSAE